MTATLYAMESRKSAPGQDSGSQLEFIEVNTGPAPAFAVIWLHGLGADGHDFEPIVPYLGLPREMQVRFIFPHALMRPVTINGGAVMRAWYDIIEFSLDRNQDKAGILDSENRVCALIDAEIRRGIPASRIVLAGFSQGGAMAMQVGLVYPQRLAGIMALSAYLLTPENLQAGRELANADTPVFIGHGSQDPVVPMFLGQAMRSALQQRGWNVEWHDYPIPHSVSQEEIADIGRWLRNCLV